MRYKFVAKMFLSVFKFIFKSKSKASLLYIHKHEERDLNYLQVTAQCFTSTLHSDGTSSYFKHDRILPVSCTHAAYCRLSDMLQNRSCHPRMLLSAQMSAEIVLGSVFKKKQSIVEKVHH